MRNWIMFWTLGLIWGSSFLLIKIGIQELVPLALVSGRLSITAIAFIIAFAVMRQPLPRDFKTLRNLAIAGVINTAIPFVIITWAENSIDSGLASVLQATVPLFSIVIAHLVLHDDKIHQGKILGLITGMLGVIALAIRSVDPTHPNAIEDQLAMLLASLFYAVGAVFVRQTLRNVAPLVSAGGSMIAAAIVVDIVLVLTVRPLPNIVALHGVTMAAVVGLGLVNTFLAYILYYQLISHWGASRTTMVTYVTPAMGLLLGTLIAHEPLDVLLIVGTILIIGGIGLANWRRHRPSGTPTTNPAADIDTPAHQKVG